MKKPVYTIHDGYKVEVRTYKRNWVKMKQFILHYPLSGPQDWSISKEKYFIGMDRNKGSDDIQIGVPAFDRECLLTGNEDFLRSLLNEKVREKIFLLHQVTEEFQVNGQMISAMMRKEDLKNTAKQDALIQIMIETAQVLSEEPDMFKRCVNNILNDPYIPFRMFNLAILHSSFPDRRETAATIQAVLADPDLDIRIHASIVMGVSGMSLLKDLLLQQDLNPAQMRDIIQHFIIRNYSQTTSILMECYKNKADLGPGDKLILLQGLSTQADSSARDFLMTELEKEKDRDLRIALVDALGMCGDIPAVEYLYKWELAHPDVSIKDSIKRAIRRIQARQDVKGDKGWLSLNETGQSEGGLSLPHEDEGGLSMAEEE